MRPKARSCMGRRSTENYSFTRIFACDGTLTHQNQSAATKISSKQFWNPIYAERRSHLYAISSIAALKVNYEVTSETLAYLERKWIIVWKSRYWTFTRHGTFFSTQRKWEKDMSVIFGSADHPCDSLKCSTSLESAPEELCACECFRCEQSYLQALFTLDSTSVPREY